jgi:hypothetical protein
MIGILFLLNAAAAQAKEFHSDAEAGKTTTLSGAQVEQLKFTTNTGSIKCSTATFEGSMVGPHSEMMALKPSYSGCKAFGVSAQVTDIEIYYTYTWTVFWYHMVVSAGLRPLAFTPVGIACTVTIGEQTVNQVKFENKESGGVKDILGTNEITGIKYTETGSECSSPGTHENGTYSGTETVKGINEASGSTSIWVE